MTAASSNTAAGAGACAEAGWVYLMTNRPNGTLYLGVTSDLARRAWRDLYEDLA